MSGNPASNKPVNPVEHSVHSPDEVIIELGGCGRFQIRIAILVHVIKTICCWSTMSVVFITAVPSWRCKDDSNGNLTLGNISFDKACFTANGSKCSSFEFDTSMNTIVSEWQLICDKDWIPTTWVTISLCVNILGYLSAGHLADMFGRKVPFFLSIFLMMTFSLVSYFSVNWVMFAIVRLFVGIGSTFFLTIQYSYLSEFMLSRWRSWFIGFPSWPIQGCLMALVLWLLKDWRNFHLATAAMGLPFMAAWWFMPESFRWYYSHDRVEDAERVITVVSKTNRRPVPDMTYMKQLAVSSSKSSDKKYSVLDLFSSRSLIKVTVLMVTIWFAIGVIEMGILFGIQNLAGNFFLNIFLFRVVQIPSKSLGIWLQNRFGRRNTTMLVYVVTGVSTLLVGIVQYIDTDKRNALTIGFALVANLAMEAAWGPLQTMTVELYPTVIRNIGFSFCAVISHVGAAVAPQLVHLDISIPGILYFICAGLAVIGCCALLGVPETNNENLADKLNRTVEFPSHTSHFDMSASGQNMENGTMNSEVDKDARTVKTISNGI